jgi:uncharacterized Zn-binding protein involved in type VI secretion
MELIRLGDRTSGNGQVIGASAAMRYEGRFVARLGDEVSCLRHPDVKPNRIIEGDPDVTDHGIPVARHGHRVQCGCSLISSLA